MYLQSPGCIQRPLMMAQDDGGRLRATREGCRSAAKTIRDSQAVAYGCRDVAGPHRRVLGRLEAYQLPHRGALSGGVAGGPGFEPRPSESESEVLPLNYPPSGCLRGRGLIACSEGARNRCARCVTTRRQETLDGGTGFPQSRESERPEYGGVRGSAGRAG